MIPAVIERCAGIDVGRKFVVVCVMCGDAHATPTQQVRKFSMLTEALEQLRVWLHQNECTHVVLESTGSYWKPIFNILDDGQLEVILANSQQVKNPRGHKRNAIACSGCYRKLTFNWGSCSVTCSESRG